MTGNNSQITRPIATRSGGFPKVSTDNWTTAIQDDDDDDDDDDEEDEDEDEDDDATGSTMSSRRLLRRT